MASRGAASCVSSTSSVSSDSGGLKVDVFLFTAHYILALRRPVEREMKRFHVSRAYVISLAVAEMLSVPIDENDTYRGVVS
jgi:hypothetical protein